MSHHDKMRPFTYLQIDHICYTIGDWYLKYKDAAISGPQHFCLASAREHLKHMICGDFDISKLEDERFADLSVKEDRL
jgi:hypothetical protein